jgi:hypothetical protein
MMPARSVYSDPEVGVVEVVLPSGAEKEAIAASDGRLDYLWLDGPEAVAVGDRLQLRDRIVTVTSASSRTFSRRSTTVAVVRPDGGGGRPGAVR